jgi:16S rRNA (cytosine967-C5)-methyltransferase
MKNPELRWRVREESIQEIVELQREMLEAGVELLKPGGRLLYTTCSLLPEENEDQIRWLLERRQDLRLVPLKSPYDEGLLEGTARAWPHKHMTIGFFYALVEKKG